MATISHPELCLTLAIIFAFFMAWGVGANDVANAMGTSIGSKQLNFGKRFSLRLYLRPPDPYSQGGKSHRPFGVTS